MGMTPGAYHERGADISAGLRSYGSGVTRSLAGVYAGNMNVVRTSLHRATLSCIYGRFNCACRRDVANMVWAYNMAALPDLNICVALRITWYARWRAWTLHRTVELDAARTLLCA